MHDFIISYIGYFEDIVSLSYIIDMHASFCNIFLKSHLLTLPLSFSEISFRIQKLSSL